MTQSGPMECLTAVATPADVQSPIRFAGCRPQLATLLALLLGLFASSDCRGEDSAIDVVDRAVRAVDPDGKLPRAKAVRWHVEWNTEGEDTSVYVFQDLDHAWLLSRGYGRGAQVVISGQQGWILGDAEKAARELDRNAYQKERRRAYLSLIPIIPALLKDKSFQLKRDGKENVAGQPAKILRVTEADGQSFTLWFDETSGRLVKMIVVNINREGKQELEERLFENYKEAAGLQVPATIRGRNIYGYPQATLSLVEVKLLDEVEPWRFQAPTNSR